MKLDWPPAEYGRLTGARIEQLHSKPHETVTLQFERAEVEYTGREAAQLARIVRTFIAEQHASLARMKMTIRWSED